MLFIIKLDSSQAVVSALPSRSVEATDDPLFLLRSNTAVPEYVVGIRYTRGNASKKVLRCRLVTNLGRWSKWFGEASTADGIEIYHESFLPDGQCVESFSCEDGHVVFKSKKAPRTRPKNRKSLLGLSLEGKALLQRRGQQYPSPWTKVRSGSLLKALPIKFPSILSTKPSLLRLMLEKNDPASLLTLMTNHGKSFDASLMDLLLLHEPGNSIARMSCEKSSILGGTSIVKLSLRSSLKSHSLARLALTPCYSRGARSVMQLLIEDEFKDDVAHPSLLRMLLFQEDKQDSILRWLLLKNEKLGSSIIELALMEPSSWRPSLTRQALEDNIKSGGLSRFFSDSPINDRPALAKYLFAGGKNSIARKSLIGEREGEYSILRLLMNRNALSNGEPILELLGRRVSSSSSSLLEMMVMDDEFGLNLGRIVFETTCRVKDGILETFSNADLPPSLIESESVLSDKGSTLAHFFLSGEQQNKFSMMRALLVGEENESAVPSVLRLLVEKDVSEPKKTGTPLLVVIIEEMRRLFAMQKQTKSKKLKSHEFLPLLLKLAAALRNRGKEFGARWKAAWTFVADKVKASAQISSNCTTEWRKLAPLWASLCLAIGRKKWSQVMVRISRIGIKLDHGHGNRFMMSQRAVASAAKAGVSTGFNISKGIVSVVGSALEPLPLASDVLDGVHGVLSMAEGITKSGIDVAAVLGVGMTSLAMKAKKKSSTASLDLVPAGGEEKEGEDFAANLISQFGAALIDDDDDDDEQDDRSEEREETTTFNEETEATEVYL